MKNFRRGITDKKFISVLKEKYQEGGWWKDVVDDKELFVAIRYEYLNIYYQGNSLIKLSFDKKNDNLVAETHYKYLCRPDTKPCLITTRPNGSFFLKRSSREDKKRAIDDYLIHNLTEVDSIKKASTAYGGVEKEGIQKILNCNGNIIDLEIALTKEAEDDEGNIEEIKGATAKRIDFAAFQKNTDHYDLLFFEAKHFSNKELRAKGDSLPSVLKQISRYRKLLEKYKNEIIESYKLVCCNLCELLPPDQLDQSIIDIASGTYAIKVDIEPCLVLFGFDEDQRTGVYWGPHKEKLVSSLGKKFLAKGDPTNFTYGISKAKR